MVYIKPDKNFLNYATENKFMFLLSISDTGMDYDKRFKVPVPMEFYKELPLTISDRKLSSAQLSWMGVSVAVVFCVLLAVAMKK
jgi:hypothetical protein